MERKPYIKLLIRHHWHKNNYSPCEDFALRVKLVLRSNINESTVRLIETLQPKTELKRYICTFKIYGNWKLLRSVSTAASGRVNQGRWRTSMNDNVTAIRLCRWAGAKNISIYYDVHVCITSNLNLEQTKRKILSLAFNSLQMASFIWSCRHCPQDSIKSYKIKSEISFDSSQKIILKQLTGVSEAATGLRISKVDDKLSTWR